jgi:predicted ferric reductase
MYMHEKIKHRVLLALFAVTTLPYFVFVPRPEIFAFNGIASYNTAQYFASVFGYIGVTLLVWQLVLGARAVSGLFFENLAQKIKLHKWLGKYGVLLVFLHPLLIVYSYRESWFYNLLPNFSTEFEKHVTFGRLAMASLAIIWLTSAIARGSIAFRPWKYIHYLAYPALLFSLLHVPEVGGSFGEKGIQFFWYCLVIVSLVAALLRARFLFGFGKMQFKVIENKPLNQFVHQLRLKPVTRSIRVRAGQYVYVQIGLLGESHPFTVLDYDPKNGELLIAYKTFGRYTKKLETMPPQANVYIDGPYGVFTAELELSDAPVVFIAGGIGITPFVKHALRNDRKHYLFFANQTEETAVFRAVLKKHMGKRFIDIFSKAQPNSSKEQNTEYGMVRAELIKKYIADPKKYDYYICGPKPMMVAVRSELQSLGIDTSRIYTEEFSF